ncbi:MAG: pentapeptide repeat-containing protein [Leptolyngbya sp. SIO4C5]|nr:pentapeptide repeat-containing protein [Leptolyngbya sp. SIO4C5]
MEIKGAKLKGANLSYLDLRGINLEGTDLTDANVTGALFGNNLGLTESDKRDLAKRGAIFQEPPSSDVPSLVLR